MANEGLGNLISVKIIEGQSEPMDLLDEETCRMISEKIELPKSTEAARIARYVPPDPAHPWRDFQVQNCARRFLKEVILSDRITNHPHQNCSNIRVDEWGRSLF